MQYKQMDYQERAQRIFLLVILLSLIFHLLVFFLGYLLPHYVPNIKLTQEIMQPLSEHEDEPLSLASMKAKAQSDAQVIFRDEPAAPEQASEEEQKNNDAQEKVVEKSEAPPEEQARELEEKKINLKDPVSFLTKEHAAQKPVVQKKALPRPAPRKVAKSPVSFADLSRLMLKSMSHEVDAQVAIEGANRTPTEKDLQYSRYVEKINKCYYAILNSKRHAMPPLPAYQNSMGITLYITKQGHLEGLKVTSSSGSATVDEFISGVFKEASMSFPPLPDFFKSENFVMPYKVFFR